MLIGNRGWVHPRIFRSVTVGNISRVILHRYTCLFPYFVSNRVMGTFPRIHTDLLSRYHSSFLILALSREFLPTFVSARGTQRSRDLRVIPRTFNSRYLFPSQS